LSAACAAPFLIYGAPASSSGSRNCAVSCRTTRTSARYAVRANQVDAVVLHVSKQVDGVAVAPAGEMALDLNRRFRLIE